MKIHCIIPIYTCKHLSNIWGLFALTNKVAGEEIPSKECGLSNFVSRSQRSDQEWEKVEATCFPLTSATLLA